MRNIRYLDGLRGIAAFIVVIHHFVLGFYPAFHNGLKTQVHTGNSIELLVAKSPLNIIYSGDLAVCIFFILSGYVLTINFFVQKDPGLIVSGVLRRYIRLAVPIGASMVIAYLFMTNSLLYNQQAAKFTISEWLSNAWKFKPDFIQMVQQGLYKVFISPRNNTYNTSLWTMSYEFAGSLLVFCTALILINSRNRFVIYLLMGWFFINSYFLAFILGLALSDAYHDENTALWPRKLNHPVIIIFLLFTGLFLGSYPPESISTANSIYYFLDIKSLSAPSNTFHILGSFLIMLALLNSELLQNALSNKLFLFLGKISFSMYLIHLLVICSLSSYLFIQIYPFLGYHLSVLSAFVLSIPILFLLSWIMYKLVDSKSTEFSKYVYISIFKPNN